MRKSIQKDTNQSSTEENRRKITPSIFGSSARDQISILENLNRHLESHFLSESLKLKNRASRIKANNPSQFNDDENVYGIDDYLEALLLEFEEINCVAYELLIVGLYKIFELTLHRPLLFRYDRETAHNITKDWGKFKKRLKKDGIDIEQIPHYKKIDELRLLNNAIKHQGKVSEQLANNYKRWKKDSKFKNLDKEFEKFSRVIPKFLDRLSLKVIHKNRQT